MINVQQTIDRLRNLSPAQLKQEAQLVKDDSMMLPLVLGEDARRKKLAIASQGQMGQQPTVVDQKLSQMDAGQAQAMPEDQGIAQLRTPNMETMAAAEGGIVGYADGGMVAFAKGGQPSTDAFERAFQTVLRLEGGATYVADDAGKGPTKYGINQTANPDVDVKNLTEAKAREIYRKRYWDKIGGDALAAKNPALATIAFDAAVNQGTGPANKMVAAAGGDPTKLLEMRKQRYDALVQAKPKEYGQFSKGWDTRLASLATAAMPMGAAQAAPAPTAAPATGLAAADEARRAASISQIPGGVPMEQTPAGPAPTGNEIVKGTAKTAFALGQNLLAVPAAGISTLARKGLGAMGYGPGANFEETLGRYAYSPDDAVSQQQLAGLGKAMSDLKIPAYIPMIGGIAGASRAGAAKDAAAIAKAQNVRLMPPSTASTAAEQAAAASAQKVANLRLEPQAKIAGISPESEGVIKVNPARQRMQTAGRQGALEADQAFAQMDAKTASGVAADEAAAAAARAAAARTALTADEAAAAAARTRMGDTAIRDAGAQTVNASLPAISQRSTLGGNVATGVNAANLYPDAGAAPAGGIPDLGIDPREAFRRSELGAQKTPLTPDMAPDATAEAAGEKPSWLTNDRALMLGLNLLAQQGKPGTGSAIRDLLSGLGTAGLSTLAGEKSERSAKAAEAYQTSMGKKAEAEAAYITRGGKEKNEITLAEDLAQKRMKDWLSSSAGKLAGMDQAAQDAMLNRFRLDAYNQYGISMQPTATAAAPTGRQAWGAATVS